MADSKALRAASRKFGVSVDDLDDLVVAIEGLGEGGAVLGVGIGDEDARGAHLRLQGGSASMKVEPCTGGGSGV